MRNSTTYVENDKSIIVLFDIEHYGENSCNFDADADTMKRKWWRSYELQNR